MIQIAVCDPNAAHQAALCHTLAKLLFDLSEYHFTCFRSGEQLLESLDGASPFQLIFLEIHLGGAINGLETAARINTAAPDTDIIFITDAAEYIAEGYRYHAFDFLVKPVPLSRLEDVIDRYLTERRQRPADFLKVNIQRCSVQIPLYQIAYLESQRRKIIAHMPGEAVEFYERLDHLAGLLSGAGFIRCHQSYLVNSRYIRQLGSSDLLLSDGTRLPVSRTYFKALKAALLKTVPGESPADAEILSAAAPEILSAADAESLKQ